MMQLPSKPFIGLNRKFRKNVLVNATNTDVDEESNKFTEEIPDNTKFENILLKNSVNITKYKNEGGLVVFDDSIEIQKNYLINFQKLLEVLNYDENSVDNFINKSQGEWVNDFDKLDSNDVEFESRFESGNLRMAIQVNHNEFDLLLKSDMNSVKMYHWFYFEVKIKKSKLKESGNILKFNIINCQKKEMLFSRGLRVLKYSVQSKKWHRDTRDIYYFLNGLQMDERKFHTLTFSFEIEKEEIESCPSDELTYYFSYCHPYTYTDLNNYLERIKQYSEIENFLRIEKIGKTLCSNTLDMLIITKFNSSFDEIAQRPAVILTARVHPGESNASYVIQGVIDFLLEKDNKIAEILREKFIIKIVPMLNPDGVINGNFRSCVSGKDLNRMWVDTRENLCPTIFYTKEMIKKTQESRDIFLFCDFHGHSNKNNFFIFSCPAYLKDKKTNDELILRNILIKQNDFFDKTSCIYKISSNKTKTARAVVYHENKVNFSYCLETSIGSITIGKNKNTYYTPDNYFQIGRDFCISLENLSDNNKIQKIRSEINLEIERNKKIELDSMKFEKNYKNAQQLIKASRSKEKPKLTKKTQSVEKIKLKIYERNKSLSNKLTPFINFDNYKEIKQWKLKSDDNLIKITKKREIISTVKAAKKIKGRRENKK